MQEAGEGPMEVCCAGVGALSHSSHPSSDRPDRPALLTALDIRHHHDDRGYAHRVLSHRLRGRIDLEGTAPFVGDAGQRVLEGATLLLHSELPVGQCRHHRLFQSDVFQTACRVRSRRLLLATLPCRHRRITGY